MQSPTPITLSARNSVSRAHSPRGFTLLALTLASLALSSKAPAVTPEPDGGYPGNNTAEGDLALYSLTSGLVNTAIGYAALTFNTSGQINTATGASALNNNTVGSFNTAT